MAFHNILGKRGEDEAAKFLIKTGYTILERSWKWKQLEIDIIAQKDNFLVVVEVKSRSSVQHADPDDLLSKYKLKCLYDATERYMDVTQCNLEVRYDLITVIDHGETVSIEHIEEAFYPFMS